MPELKQGDIFSVGKEECSELAIVFGHIGFNEMSVTWGNFSKNITAFAGIDNPFNQISGPTEYRSGQWIWFISSEKNHGMTEAIVSEVLNDAIKWACRNNVRRIITNGIADIDHGHDTAKNRVSDERRARFMVEFATHKEIEYGVSITLIGLNDIFVRKSYCHAV